MRPDHGGVVPAIDRVALPFDAAFEEPVDGLQEVGAVRLDVKADEVGPEQPVEQLALPGTNAERFRIGPGNVPEHGDSRIGPAFFDHRRQQGEVVVLHQQERIGGAFDLFELGIRELAGFTDR